LRASPNQYSLSRVEPLDYIGQTFGNLAESADRLKGISEMNARPFPENLQRVGFLSCVPDLLRRFNTDPFAVLAAAGLTADALDDPDGTIPYRTMGLLMRTACEETRCAHFGLEVGREIRIDSLGLLGEFMRNSPTLRVALQDFALHHHRNAHGGIAYLMEDEVHAFFGYAVYEPNLLGYSAVCDGAAMAAFNIFCELASVDHLSGLEVLFSRFEPENMLHYRNSFGVKLSFNAHQTAVVFPRRLLDRPIAGADAQRRLELEKQVRALWHVGDMDLVTQLRRELRVALIRGDVSAVTISARLGMGRRTLHRRLSDLGLQFQEALDETRCDYVQQLLAYTRLEIASIASIVGYTDPSVLTRGFVRWTGVTPSQWRTKRMTDANDNSDGPFSPGVWKAPARN
jgi:AraC-like DNA-binding protein